MNDLWLAADESRALTLNLRICATGCDEACGSDPVSYAPRVNGDRLLVTIRSGRNPVPGAELTLRSPHTAGPLRRATTNAGGDAEIDDIPFGDYVLSATASAYQTTTVSDVRILAHRATIVTIDLLPNERIRACQ